MVINLISKLCHYKTILKSMLKWKLINVEHLLCNGKFSNLLLILLQSLSSRPDASDENDLCEVVCCYICNFEVSCTIDFGALNPSPWQLHIQIKNNCWLFIETRILKSKWLQQKENEEINKDQYTESMCLWHRIWILWTMVYFMVYSD